jgi:hypothetical protein
VFPSFGGTWEGVATVTNCQASGEFVGAFCVEDAFEVGEVYEHDSRFTQTNETVQAAIDFGQGAIGNTTGTITVDGELQLATTAFGFEGLLFEIREWRSRADEPSRMTGTHQVVVSIPGISGSTTISFRLDNVVKVSSTTALWHEATSGVHDTLRRTVARIPRR